MRIKDLGELLKTHFVDTTGILTATHPIYSFWENFVLGYSDNLSINARLRASWLFYAGAGFLFSQGRKLYHKTRIALGSNPKAEKLHDIFYAGAFGAVFSAATYIGQTSTFEQFALGVVTGTALGMIAGIPAGFGIKCARSLTGLPEQIPEQVAPEPPKKTIPKYLRELPRKAKLKIAAGSLAASLAIMSTVYTLTPKEFKGVWSYVRPCVMETSQDSSQEF